MKSAPTAPTSAPARSARPWSRLHSALMPDYNGKAIAFWWVVVMLGTAALVHSAAAVLAMPPAAWLQIALGMVITMVAGYFPVRVPRTKNSFAAGEVFIFLLLLLHGPAAATLAAAGEALIGALRSTSRWTSRIASPAMAALAMLIAGLLLQALRDTLLRHGWANPGLVVVAAMAFALVYFALNTLLISALPRLKRNQPLQIGDMMGVFGWVGIAFAGSAAVAALLYLTSQQSGLGVLMAVIPVIVMLLVTLHYYYHQLDTNEAARDAAAAAAAREAEAAALAVAREAQARATALAREAELAARHLRELQDSERRFHSAFTHASIGMALLLFDGTILQANAALRALLGVNDAALLDHSFQDFVAETDRQALNQQLGRVTEDGEGFALELRCRRSDGAEVWVAVHCSYFSEPGSSAPRLILQVQDIHARREAEAGLHHIAFHDILTGLPNRRRFGEHLRQAIELARVDPAQGFAVMFLDFDRFKLINDSLGHQAGDDFLVQVSRRIQGKLRPHDIVARLGGDEFAVLSLQVGSASDVTALADRLMDALREPYRVAETVLNSSASIGITTSSLGYTRSEDVLRDADTAMYKAKSSGKDRYAMFDTALHTEVVQRLHIEGELRHAIQAAQLSVAYQPLYTLATGRLCGFEALARWTHAELGAIGPDVFIPIAEETGLIVALTDMVLHSACQQLAQWQRLHPAFATLTMNVNISSKDVGHTGLVARVAHALLQSHLQPQSLTVELTENILMERLAAASPILDALRAMGVGLSVDDFGTGYSSLAHLARLPVDTLKIDRSFIRDLRHGTNEATVVRAIVNLGNSLGKSVIAEGIETASQFAQLCEMGCHVGQGFHMSRPLTADAVQALLARTLADRLHPVHATPFESATMVH